MPQAQRAVRKAIYDAVGDAHNPQAVLEIVMVQDEFQ
jgi:hypothetical protein